MSAESVSQISAPEWDAVSGSGLKRKLHPRTSPQSGMNFPNGAADGNCVPESSPRVGRAFPSGALPETASRIQASEWDSFSGRGLKWKVRPRTRNGAVAQLCVRTDGYVYCNVVIRGKDGCHGNG